MPKSSQPQEPKWKLNKNRKPLEKAVFCCYNGPGLEVQIFAWGYHAWRLGVGLVCSSLHGGVRSVRVLLPVANYYVGRKAERGVHCGAPFLIMVK